MFNKIKRYLKNKKESRDFGDLLGKWCKLRFENIHMIKEGDVKEFEKTKKEINYNEVISSLIKKIIYKQFGREEKSGARKKLRKTYKD